MQKIKNILIVDDDLIFQLFTTKMLQNANSSINVISCENGLLAYEKCKELLNQKQDFVVLLDINMPVMDGWEFINKCSKELIGLERIQLFMVSSSTNSNDIEKAKNHHCIQKYYIKPLSITDINEIASSI